MKNNNITGWLENNKTAVSFFCAGILLGIFIMACFWPKRIAQLDNGQEVVVSIEGKDFTANDLYNKLKENSGLDALLNLVDINILKEKYELGDEADAYAKEQSESIYKLYEQNYGFTKEQFLEENNFKDEAEFLGYLKEEYLYQTYYEDYLKEKITDKEIKEFYKNTVDSTKKIYVFSAAEEENDLKSVIKDLKKKKSFEDISKKYENVIANDIGEVSFDTYSSYSEEFIKQLKKLKKGEASSVFSDDTFGYTVIYVTDEKEKPSLEEAKEDIIKTLSDKMSSEDEKLYYKALIEMRDNKKIKFSDSQLQKEYETYKKQYK